MAIQIYPKNCENFFAKILEAFCGMRSCTVLLEGSFYCVTPVKGLVSRALDIIVFEYSSDFIFIISFLFCSDKLFSLKV